MHAHVRIYTHTYTHIYTHTNTHTHIHTHTNTHTRTAGMLGRGMMGLNVRRGRGSRGGGRGGLGRGALLAPGALFADVEGVEFEEQRQFGQGYAASTWGPVCGCRRCEN